MVDDLEAKARGGPWFRHEPESKPWPAPEQLPGHTTYAPFDHAILSLRRMGKVWARASESLRGYTQRIGILHPGPVGRGPQGGNGQNKPITGHSAWVCPSSVLPLPTHTLEGAEPQLDPEAQTIPTYPHILWGQIGNHHPGFLLASVPHHQQSAEATTLDITEGGATSYPGVAWSRNQLPGWLAASPKGITRAKL